MKKIKVRFERDETLSCIDVLCRADDEDEEVKSLMRRIEEIGVKKITAQDKNGNIYLLPHDNILSVSVRGKRLSIKTDGGVYFSQTPLQAIEKELDTERFVRISRFEIVNTDKIAKFDFTLSGTLRIEFQNGDETWASRRSIPQIRKRLFGKERQK